MPSLHEVLLMPGGGVRHRKTDDVLLALVKWHDSLAFLNEIYFKK